MFKPRFVLPEFDANHRELANSYLRVLLDAGTGIAILCFRQFPALPDLYGGHFRYIRENPKSTDPVFGPEDWQSPQETFARGGGDCEDLVFYRVGELRVKHGIKAHAQFFWRDRPANHPHGPGSTYHIVVQHPNGTLEDPSKRLGMGRV